MITPAAMRAVGIESEAARVLEDFEVVAVPRIVPPGAPREEAVAPTTRRWTAAFEELQHANPLPDLGGGWRV